MRIRLELELGPGDSVRVMSMAWVAVRLGFYGYVVTLLQNLELFPVSYAFCICIPHSALPHYTCTRLRGVSLQANRMV